MFLQVKVKEYTVCKTPTNRDNKLRTFEWPICQFFSPTLSSNWEQLLASGFAAPTDVDAAYLYLPTNNYIATGVVDMCFYSSVKGTFV